MMHLFLPIRWSFFERCSVFFQHSTAGIFGLPAAASTIVVSAHIWPTPEENRGGQRAASASGDRNHCAARFGRPDVRLPETGFPADDVGAARDHLAANVRAADRLTAGTACERRVAVLGHTSRACTVPARTELARPVR
jgi:hypothetical protein